MARAGAIRIDTSGAILTETMGVLRDKFGWEGYRLRFGQEALRKLARVVEPTTTIDVADDRTTTGFLECAVEAGSDFIVTEDKTYCGLEVTGASPSSVRRTSCIERFEARILIYNPSVV